MNTIRELKQQEKYNNMLKRKNKEIEKLKEELKDLNRILCVWNSRELINKFNKEYDKEDLEKNPNREYVVIYPDAEEVYKRYYKQKAIIKEVREYIENNKIYTNEKQEAYTLKNTWYGIELLGILEKENK